MDKIISIQELIQEWEDQKTNLSLKEYINRKIEEWYKIKSYSLFEEYEVSVKDILSDNDMNNLIIFYKNKCLSNPKTSKCEEALNKIVKSLSLLIISEALRISNWDQTIIKDLIHIWILAVLVAIEKYNFNKNTKFSTYAIRRIRNFMYKELYKMNKIIDIPSWIINEIKKIERELSEYNQASWEEMNMLSYIDQETNMTKKTLIGFQNSVNNFSINKKIGDDDDKVTSIEDLLPSGENIKWDVQKNFLKKIIWDYLQILPDRERNILIYRYWLFNSPKKTLEELGLEYGLSRERVRQIEEKIISNFKKYLERNWISRDELFI